MVQEAYVKLTHRFGDPGPGLDLQLGPGLRLSPGVDPGLGLGVSPQGTL